MDDREDLAEEQTCTFISCNKPPRSSRPGLCGGHRQQARAGKELTPLRPRKASPEGPKGCSVKGCTKAHNAKGFCQGHYLQWSKTGETSTLKVLKPRKNRVCGYLGCGKPLHTQDHCLAHGLQFSSGVDLKPLRGSWDQSTRNSQGFKWCNPCSTWKAESEFGSSRAKPDGLNSSCKDCLRFMLVKIQYNLTRGQFLGLVDSQGGACAICREAPERVLSLHVDHDHSCCSGNKSCGVCVRGLLCGGCNSMLGMAQDSCDTLRAAVTYLCEAQS